MKILSAQQIREADAYTISHEPIASADLMERAAKACAEWINTRYSSKHPFKIICGTGNNGGDGLAFARILHHLGYNTEVYVIRYSQKSSEDFLINEGRLKKSKIPFYEIHTADDLPVFNKDEVIIDAIFGTGLSKPIEGLAARVIECINQSSATVISIDLPSGLFADQNHSSEAVVCAQHTLSFQVPKLAFMFSENEKYVGQWHLLDIELQIPAEKSINSKEYITVSDVKPMLKPRTKFSHKGNYGHALLVAGGVGKMGAAVLAAKACLRTGVGLTTVQTTTEQGISIIQTAIPEAMVIEEHEDDYSKYSAIGIGPGIGTSIGWQRWLKNFLSKNKTPLVLDADALNILSLNKELLKQLPPESILTPHPKEFERLAGKTTNEFERHQIQLDFSKQYNVWVVLKGAFTCITSPDGNAFFNSTGNPGMAKGGSGDVLTGIITSLLAQGYTSYESALLGVYLHGLAGDIAAARVGMDGMIARDIIQCIPTAFKKVRSYQ